jgi:hypothetical protein
MKKNLYTLFTVAALLFAITASKAQVNVTYQVDITNYLTSHTIDGTGMRIAGTFSDLGATRADNSNAISNWAPTDANSAMTDMGSNIWSITVTYSDTAAGNTQLFKFVNGNWGVGADEGDSGIDTDFVTEGCGFGDAGNYNRTLVIPGSDLVLQFCWGHCFKCDGSSPVISGVNEIHSGVASLDVSPNLVTNYASINYVLPKNGNVNIVVRGFDGRVVSSLVNKTQSPGSYNLDLLTDGLANGVYFVQMNTAGISVNKRFVVNR